VVFVQRDPGGIKGAWTLHEARFDEKGIVFAVAIGVLPVTDRVPAESRLDLAFLWPLAPVGVNAAGIMDVLDQHVHGLRGNDDLHWLVDGRLAGHAGRKAGQRGGSAGRVIALVGLPYGLIFGRQWWIGRPPVASPVPFAAQIGISWFIESQRPGVDQTEQRCRKHRHFHSGSPAHVVLLAQTGCSNSDAIATKIPVIIARAVTPTSCDMLLFPAVTLKGN